MTKLITCPACRRHVFEDERSCPFCSTPSPRRMPLVVAAVLAVGLAQAAACDTPDPEGARRDNTGRAAATTSSAAPTASPTPSPAPAPSPTEMSPRPPVAVYGGPPVMSITPPPSAVPSGTGSSSAPKGPPAVVPGVIDRPPATVYGGPPASTAKK